MTVPSKAWPGSSACVTAHVLAEPDLLRVGLRHAHVEPQPVGLGHHEQRAPGAAVAGIDEVADIDVALGDHPVHRRDDPLEAFQLGEAAHVRVGRREVRHRLVVGALAVVEFLLRDRIALAQLLRAIERGLRQSQRGLHLLALRHGLREFLVDLGRVELGEHLAGLHVRADIGVPAAHVAAGARVDRRLHVAAQGAGQGQARIALGGARLDHAHVLARVLLGKPVEPAAVQIVGHQGARRERGQHHAHHHQGEPGASADLRAGGQVEPGFVDVEPDGAVTFVFHEFNRSIRIQGS